MNLSREECKKKYYGKYLKVILRNKNIYGKYDMFYYDEDDNNTEYFVIQDLKCKAKLIQMKPKEIIDIEIVDKDTCLKNT